MWTTLRGFLTGRLAAAEAKQSQPVVAELRRRSSALDPFQGNDRPGPVFESGWRDGFKRRIFLSLVVIGVWVAGVEARLVWLQVVQHGDYLKEATRQHERMVKSAGVRGDIVDRNGETLAFSVMSYMINVTPSLIGDVQPTVNALCGALEDCTDQDRVQITATLSRDSGTFSIRRATRVTPEQGERVKALRLTGFDLIPETRRVYPKSDLAPQILGYVGVDNTGLSGIERKYDGDIRGQQGLVYLQVDGRQARNVMDSRVVSEATEGATVELTIDQYLQHIAERELKDGVIAHHAEGGAAVVMNPSTGEILAMASYPDFDPNNVNRSTEAGRSNRAIDYTYEPGSTFKIVTASAALQEGVWSLDDTVDCSPGRLSIPGRSKPITEALGHNYGPRLFGDVIVVSSNVGAAKIGLKVGPERFLRYVQRLGFGQRLLPDLAGESAGRVFNLKDVNDSALASMSMGYQVGVTPLQMATAVSAVANGGTLYQPHLLRAKVIDGVRTVNEPKALRQALTTETTAAVTSIMEDVVRRGTGTKAQLDKAGYIVAGKTGTASKIVDRKYSETDYNSSFVGFVPSRSPALAIVVVVDTPRGGVYFGGDVAAPIFKRIAEASLQHLGVPRTLNPVPAVLVAASTQEETRPMLLPATLTAVPALEPGRMPDVRGLGLREAMSLLAPAGVTFNSDGSGVIVTQSPDAGAPLAKGDKVTLHLGGAAALAPATGSGGARR